MLSAKLHGVLVPDTHSLLAFMAASLIVLLIPGPGVLYVFARTTTQGLRAGLISVLGLAAGVLVHIAAAVAGISAVLMASGSAFNILRLLGACYLIYLGLRTLLTRSLPTGTELQLRRTSRRIFTDGVLVSILNPKLALFFLAFLPQFVTPGRLPVPYQILYLGFVYAVLALITDGTYALLAGHIQSRLTYRVMTGPLPRYLSGSVLVSLGLGAALTGSQH